MSMMPLDSSSAVMKPAAASDTSETTNARCAPNPSIGRCLVDIGVVASHRCAGPEDTRKQGAATGDPKIITQFHALADGPKELAPS